MRIRQPGLSRYTLYAWVTGLTVLAVPGSAQLEPFGENFVVNTYTTSYQEYPAVATLESGGFVVAWRSEGSLGDDQEEGSIQAQRFSSIGEALGSEFQVNTYTTGNQRHPSVAATVDGGFIVLWDSRGSPETDTSSASVHGRRYSMDGSALDNQFQVNTYTTSFQVEPDVAASSTGIVVVWESNGSGDGDTSWTSVHGRRYGTDGIPLGGQFQINTTLPSSQRRPAVAMTHSGDFIVVWDSESRGRGVFGRYFTADGIPTSDQFDVDTQDVTVEQIPDVAMNPQGGFAVVWQSGGSIQNEARVRFFDQDAVPLGPDYQANTITYHIVRKHGAVTSIGPAGDFLVVWHSIAPVDGTLRQPIQGRLFSSTGIPFTTEEFLVSSQAGVEYHGFPAVAANPANRVLVAWHSGDIQGSVDGSRTGILARNFLFRAPAAAIPTLGTWGLVALIAVLALLALTKLRKIT